MAKVKREPAGQAGGNCVGELAPSIGSGYLGSGSRNSADREERDQRDQQVKKKQKTSAGALKFSIESIMQPTGGSTSSPADTASGAPGGALAQAAAAAVAAAVAANQRNLFNQAFMSQQFQRHHHLASAAAHHQHQHQHHQQESPSLSGSGGSSPARSASSALDEPGCPRPQELEDDLDELDDDLQQHSGSSQQNQQQQLAPSSIPQSLGLPSGSSGLGGAPGQPSGSSSSSSGSGVGRNCGGNVSRLSQVECQLDNKDMWDKFHSLNTEMIITKTGRRMFPVMKVQFYNLDPNARYAVSMSIVPVDNKRYRYAYHKSCWQVAGKADPHGETRIYPHPDSPFNGDLLARQVISFEKVKLTNNEMDKSGHIILNSMHKYQPQVHLIELKTPQAQTTSHQTTSKSSLSTSSSSSVNYHHHKHAQQNNNHHHHHHHHHHQQQAPPPPAQLDYEGWRTFEFPETVFTAVTAYQNQLITKMKIDKNPFAKGFRDSSRLSDLDRNDPFDYMGSLGPSSRFSVGQAGAPSSLEAAAAAAGAHMDAYQLLASAANNPWYSAAAVAAATAGSGGAGNPFSPMSAAACSTAQAAQLQATQMWLAAFSAAFSGGGGGAGGGGPGAPGQGPPPMPSLGPLGLGQAGLLPMPGPSPHLGEQALGESTGPDSSGGSSSSSANSSGTST